MSDAQLLLSTCHALASETYTNALDDQNLPNYLQKVVFDAHSKPCGRVPCIPQHFRLQGSCWVLVCQLKQLTTDFVDGFKK